MRFCLLLLILCITAIEVLAQVTGKVTNDKREPLIYANILVDGSTKGTATNLQGEYRLSLQPGSYNISFQYIGYSSKKIEVDLQNAPLEINVVLEGEQILLSEVIISADGEDPAYAIMRKTIANREKNKKKVSDYQGDVYIKGQVKILDAPESFLGQSVGNMEGVLDSSRQGIVYLSESQSDVYYQSPDQYKEVMTSSIVSGNDNGFSFNQFSSVDFNFYNENLRFDRSLVSPLNDNAFSHYHFKLIGVTVDESGRQVNKIQVIPKNEFSGVFKGTIYILDEIWTIHSLDLTVTGKAIKNGFLKYVRVRQIMQEYQDEIWYLQQQIIDFEGGFFSFKMGGVFSYIFNEIKINNGLDDEVFGPEVFAMAADAGEKSMEYWNSIRPIPLTLEEEEDYIKKDILEKKRTSKGYLDSIDRINNQFKWSKLVFGYDHNNTFKKRYLSYSSPVSQLRFNLIEGFAVGSKINFRKYSTDENKRLSLTGMMRYGFSDSRLKYELSGNYRFSRKYFSWMTFALGDDLFQFDERNPISFGGNTWSNLLYKRNYLRLYRKKYLDLGFQKEMSNGFYIWLRGSYQKRIPVNINTDYSLFYKDRVYEGNHPTQPFSLEAGFENHTIFITSMTIRWRPGQKYYSYPDLRLRIPSQWPDIYLTYQKAININDQSADYDRLLLRIADRRIGMNEYGYGTINLEAGAFVKKNRVEIMDYFHFLGNEPLFSYFDRYYRSFKLMPYYDFSTSSDFVSIIYEHHFEGYLLDRIPLLKNLRLKMVIGGGLMKSAENTYYETTVGLENFTLGPLNLFRLDYGWGFDQSGMIDHGFRIGISRILNAVVD